MTADPERLKQNRQIALLWCGVLLGPVAWLAGFTLKYALVPAVCRTGAYYWLHIAAAGTLAAALIGLWIAWREWRITGESWPDANAGAVSRSRFLAFSGVVLSISSAVLTVGQWIPVLVLHPCQQ